MSYQIIQNVSIYDIKDLFKKMDRDYFSIEAIEAIMDDMEEINEGNPFDLDVIAICCDYSESTLEEVYEEHKDAPELADMIEEIKEMQAEDNTLEEVELLDERFYDYLDGLDYSYYRVLDSGNILFRN